MPMRKFTAALTIGSVPTAFAFAAIGVNRRPTWTPPIVHHCTL
jgi:hypothetical protein